MTEDQQTIMRLINASTRAAEELERQAEAQRAAVLRMLQTTTTNSEDGDE